MNAIAFTRRSRASSRGVSKDDGPCQSSFEAHGACHRAALRADPLARASSDKRRSRCAGMTDTSALLAVGVLPGLHLHLAGRERRRRRAAFLDVLVGLRFLLFLVAAHLTLGHDVAPCAGLEDVARAEHSKCAGVCNA